MRICRGNEIIGEWSAGQIKKRIADATLFPSDRYYDDDSSEWLPLANLPAGQTASTAVKVIGRSCYCGSGLSFHICHGDGSRY